MLDRLPCEICQDILLRLPLKTIFQLRCVSKPYSSIARDPSFIHALALEQPRVQKLVFLREAKVYSLDCEAVYDKPVEIHPPSEVPSEGIQKIWGHCNGFLCVTTKSSEATFLWNPYTRKYKKVPTKTPKHTTDNVNLPWVRSMYMIGYDDDARDYIVVGIFNYLNCGGGQGGASCYYFHSEVEVFSARNNSWRRMQDILYNGEWCETRGRFIDGSFYWPARRSDLQLVVLTYKVDSGRIFEVPLPPREKPIYSCLTVVGLDKDLCVVFHRYFSPRRYNSVAWVLKNCDADSWTSLEGFHGFLKAYNTLPICYTNDGEYLLMTTPDTDYLHWYHRKTRNLRGIQGAFDEVISYTESIMSLNCAHEKTVYEAEGTKTRDVLK